MDINRFFIKALYKENQYQIYSWYFLIILLRSHCLLRISINVQDRLSCCRSEWRFVCLIITSNKTYPAINRLLSLLTETEVKQSINWARQQTGTIRGEGWEGPGWCLSGAFLVSGPQSSTPPPSPPPSLLIITGEDNARSVCNTSSPGKLKGKTGNFH